MRYREIKPSAALRRFVECFWILEGGGSAAAPPERILPDGIVNLTSLSKQIINSAKIKYPLSS